MNIRRLLPLLIAAASLIAFRSVPQVSTITVDPATTYQTMDGWEATANAAQIDGPMYAVHPGWAADSPVLMDLLVNDLGITRLRLEVRSGSENPTDYYQQFKDHLIDRPNGFGSHRYDVVNDNSDPFLTDQSKFHWTELDETIQLLANPFRAKVVASGQTPHIALCYVDFDNQSVFKHSDSPAEYAEFILAAFQHIQSTFGWVPDALDVILEGDIAQRWQDPIKIGQSLAAASARLAAAGFHPEFIAPSATSLTWAVNNFDALVGVPGVVQSMTTASYHLYWNNADADLIGLSAKASARGMKTAMTELIGADHMTLSNDLRKANVSSWQQYQMASYYLPDGGAKYYINTGSGYFPGDRTRYLRQYMRYIRPGAVRIGATSVAPELTPVAFINPGGKYTVVANATTGVPLTVANLPAGTYGIRYTTATATDVDPGNQTIAAGGTIATSIPAAGAITIFNIPSQASVPGSFGKSSPSGGALSQPTSLTLAWTASSNATGYEYCLDIVNNGVCDTSWQPAGSATSAAVSGLTSGASYYWQVRATNTSGTTYADGGATAFTSFSTQVISLAPGAFGKASPANGTLGIATSLALSWAASAGAASYEYCVDTTNNSVCDAAWVNVNASFSAALSGLATSTTYYWQVRARNAIGTLEANNNLWWSFATSGSAAVNVAAAANGAVATASSVNSGNYPASGAIDGNRRGDPWGGGTGWNDGTPNQSPDWLQVTFAGAKTIGEVDVFSLQDAYNAPSDPTPTMLFSLYGLTDFQVQYWDGAQWQVVPNGTIQGNSLVWRQINFPAVTTTAIRIFITGALDAWSRLVEVEAYAGSTDGAPTPIVTTSSATAIGQTSATLNGTVNPNGLTTSTGFHFGPTIAYGSSIAAQTLTGSSGQAISATPTLACGQLYHFRAWGTNSNGTTLGPDLTLTTAACVPPPGAFNKTEPANGVTGIATTFPLGWSFSSGATAIEYCVDTTNNGVCDTAWVNIGLSNGVWLSGLATGTTYYWQVRAINAGGIATYANGSPSAFWSLTTQAGQPGAFAKTAPANAATGIATSVTLSWSASSGATGYEYCIDSSNNNACDAAWVSAGGATSAVVGGLGVGSSYSWQVRATNSTGTPTYADGAPATFWNFQTVPGQSAQLTTPASGSTLTASNVTFQWTGGLGATRYWLSLGSTPGANDVFDADMGTNLTVNVDVPVDGRSLYVHLQSLVGGVWQANDYVLTAARIFSIAKAELTSPAPRSTLTASTVTFEWSGGAGATEYRLSIGNAQSVFDLLDENEGTALKAVVSGLPTDGRLVFVRLWSQFEGAWEFNDYVVTAATTVTPRKAELKTPAPASTLTASTVTFEWTGGTGVTATHLAVGTSPGTGEFFDDDVSDKSTVAVTGLPTDGRTVYIRLSSQIAGEWQASDYTVASATIARPAARAELTTPAPGSTLAASSVTFEWTGGTGASGYWLYVGNTPGGNDVVSRDAASNLSALVTGMPTDGRPLYVRLFSHIGEDWQYNDYVLTAATIAVAERAQLLSPAPESTLTATGVTFQWSGGVGVSAYRLAVGTTAGAADLAGIGPVSDVSAMVGGLPTDGRTIYVRLGSLIAGAWQYNDYTFHATTLVQSRAAELVSPAPGSTLTSTTATFRWTAGVGAAHYRLVIGSKPGSDDIAYVNADTALGAVVSSLPSDGRAIYVSLYSYVDGAWQRRDYVFTAAGK